ncbi:hypothetical protein BaRGS_00000814 [Batillaria attramentaria]|uniref:Zinc finger CCHC domain-containing protein 7 n=1 Tax=Batillaria attramentaria TaxID=370345 RepID=A0ABD0M8U9_9CAEN
MMDAMDAGSDNSNDIMDDGEEEEDIDEEMEAILYSQVHFACGDAMDGEPADEDCSFQPAKQISDYRAAFSVSVTQVKVSESITDKSYNQLVDREGRKSRGTSQTEARVTTVDKKTDSAQHRTPTGKLVVPDTKPVDNAVKIFSVSDSSCTENDVAEDIPCLRKNTRTKPPENENILRAKPLPSVPTFSKPSKSEGLNYKLKPKKAQEDVADACGSIEGKKGKTVKRKFDMEVELGIKKSNRDALSSPDTLTVKKNTTAKQFKAQFGSPQFISLLGSDSDDGKNSTKHSQKSPPLSRRQLNDLMGRSGMQKNRKEIVVIDSDDSSSTSSSESSASVTENSTMNDSSEADSDTDSEVMVISSGEGSRTRTPTLDLNWNVDAADRQTIQIVEDLNSQAQGEESKWMINDSDRYRDQKSAPVGSRYYTKMDIRCRNCDKKGHLSKVCPEPRKQPACGLCGETGHTLQRCPGRLCYNCNQPGHTGVDCPSRRRNRNTECRRCWMKGHMGYECPDLWRQYHLTIPTSEGSGTDGLVMRKKEQNSRVYCCNCARKGHFAFECIRERMDKYSQPSYPFIATYDSVKWSGGRDSWEDKGITTEGAQDGSQQMPGGDVSQQTQGHGVIGQRSVSQGQVIGQKSGSQGQEAGQRSSEPAGHARRVSNYVRGFLNQDISGDDAESGFRIPATPAKSSKESKRQHKNRDSSAAKGHDEPQKKKSKKASKNEKKQVQQSSSRQDAASQSPPEPKRMTQREKAFQHKQMEARKQKQKRTQPEDTRHVKEQTVQSAKGFRTSVNNLVISRTFHS